MPQDGRKTIPTVIPTDSLYKKKLPQKACEISGELSVVFLIIAPL